MKRRLLIFVVLFPLLLLTFFLGFKYYSKAAPIKANIIIDTTNVVGPVPDRWKALAQGGEEMGARMLENVIPQLAELYPRYIRLDHIYDFYNVVGRDTAGQLTLNWTQLDQTICDIYHTGAKPFLSLGYMPPAMSQDGTLIGKPKKWDEWAFLVQKTIEHYSGLNTRLCGQITGYWLTDIYYEVWNEPDLEVFGKWSIYNGNKDYKELYYYSDLGAKQAQNVNRFLLGGPTTTALYQNWIQNFLAYAAQKNLRVDFISWHHYSKNPDDYTDDMKKINKWLNFPQYAQYQNLPKIISEWGYNSDPDPISHTNIGAAHSIMAIRNFIDADYKLAFLFEIKDGPEARWGVLNYNGGKTPRYDALQLLNQLDGNRLKLDGEGTFIKGLASYNNNLITLILVNYDQNNANSENVPITFINLVSGKYELNIRYLTGQTQTFTQDTGSANNLEHDLLMPPNTIVLLQLKRTTLSPPNN